VHKIKYQNCIYLQSLKPYVCQTAVRTPRGLVIHKACSEKYASMSRVLMVAVYKVYLQVISLS